MKQPTKQELIAELIKKYEEAETGVIWEFSTTIAAEEAELAKEIAMYKERLLDE